MERSRETRRPVPGAGGVTNRRLRGGALSTKDISDEDERTDDSPDNRAWERSKKERMKAFQCLSRTKRRRQDIILQSRNSICDDADESREEIENLGWFDDDDEPPLHLPVPRRLGKFRGGGKEDEMIMDIPMVPRKARSALSSSSRFSVLRRLPPTDNLVLQYPSVTSDDILSPNSLGKSARRPKPNGMKFRPLKPLKVLEPTTISDQEVEVAEALFVLARSAPSNAVLSHGQFDCKLETTMATGISASSSPPTLPPTTICPSMHVSSTLVDGHSRSAPLPMAEAPKRKRPRVIMKQEQGRISATGEGSSSARSNATPLSDTPEMVQEPLSEAQQRSEAHIHNLIVSNIHNDKNSGHGVEEIKGSTEENHVSGEVEPVKSELQELGDLNGEIVLSPKPGDALAEKDTTGDAQPHNRSGEIPDDNGCASPSDPMACAVMEPSVDTNAKQLLIHDHSTLSGDGHAEAAHVEEENSQQKAVDEEMDNSSKANGRPVDLNLELKHEAENLMPDPPFINQAFKLIKEEEKEIDLESIKRAAKTTETDTDKMASVLLPPSMPDASGTSLALANWMNNLPAKGYCSSGAPLWPSTGPLVDSDLDLKSAHPSVQLPSSAMVPRIAKLKRCAAHVYLAHFINREQHCCRHPIWSAALCRGAPYSVNMPPLSLLECGKLDPAYTDLARKDIAPQSSMSGIALGGSSLCSSSAITTTCQSTIGGLVHESGSGTAAGGGMNIAAHAQYIQSMIQQNGYTFPFTFNAPHGQLQVSQLFNTTSFYPTHLMSPLSHIQSLSHQASAVLPAQKQQHGMTGVSANASQLPSQGQTPPSATQQCSPSTSQKPQQSHIGNSAQNFYIHPEKDNAENLSTAESRLSALQRSMCGQGVSNIPNLNAMPSSLMLSSTVSAMPLQPQDLSLATIGGKHANKAHQNASLIPSAQHQQSIPQTNAMGAGLQIDGRDSSSECFPSMALPGISRGSVGPSSYGLLSVAPMMTTQSHGLALESSESSQDHTQQQQVFGSHSQQFQRSMAKSSGPAASDASLVCSKGHNSIEEKKAAVKQGIYYGEGMMSDMHTSPMIGSKPNAQPACNVGRMLNSVSATVPHTSRPASSAGAGRAAPVQNQNSKQAMARGKTVSGNSFPQNAAANAQIVHGLVPGFSDRSLSVNLGKPSGNTYAFPGLLTPAKQGPKQVQGAAAGKAAQRMSFGQSQEVPASVVTKAQGQPLSRGANLQQGVSGAGTPQRSPSVPSSGTLSIANPSSAPKAGVVVATPKSPPNAKVSMSSVKPAQGLASTAAKKLLSVSGPLITSVGVTGQSLPYRCAAQQKNQTQVHSSFTPQQIANVSIQQQRIALKNSIGPQQQLQPPEQGSSHYKPSVPVQSSYRSDAVEQRQQYVQPPSQTSSHYYLSTPQASALYMQAQHRISYEQQYLVSHQAIPSTMEAAVATGLSPNSPNFSLGSVIAESISSISSKVGDQLQGASPPTKASSLGNTPMENIVSVVPSSAPVSSQRVSSPHSASSPYYFQLSHVLAAKAAEPKTLPDGVIREEINAVRNLPASSLSKPSVMPNHASS